MMDELPNSESQEKEVPRWVQVPAGLVLGLLTLFCGYASLVLLLDANRKAPVLAAVVGFVLLLGCFWVVVTCFRLLTGRKNRGGLMTPGTLRVVSFFFLIFPVAGLFYGLLSENESSGDLSGCNVFLRLSGASGFGSEARGQRSIKRNQTVIVVKLRQVPHALPVKFLWPIQLSG